MADEFVRAYDARTGEILPNLVPKHWVGSTFYPHIKAVPSERDASSDPPAALGNDSSTYVPED